MKRLLFVAIFLIMSASFSLAKAKGCVQEMDVEIKFQYQGSNVSLKKLVQYVAVIGTRDLYNSNNVPLTDFRSVIHQDRTNLHKTGKSDKFDTFMEKPDDYFTTPEKRNLLSNISYYYNCSLTQSGIEALNKSILIGQVEATGLSITLFRHPDGSLGAAIEPVG